MKKVMIIIGIIALTGCATLAEERAAWVQESKEKCDTSVGKYSGSFDQSVTLTPQTIQETPLARDAMAACDKTASPAQYEACVTGQYKARWQAYAGCVENNYNALVEEEARTQRLWLIMAGQLQNGLYRQADVQGQYIGTLQDIDQSRQIRQQELNQQMFNRELINAVKSLQQPQQPVVGPPCWGYSTC